MFRILTICACITVTGVLSPSILPAEEKEPLIKLSLTQLEQRLAAIDSEIGQLAHYSLRGGVGPVGYRSLSHPNQSATEWIQVEFGETTPIDQIVLVPSIWRDTKTGFRADGFPLGFKIIAGSGADTNGTVLATFTKADHLLPRIAPVVVSCNATASWLRVEATDLSQRAWDGQYDMELAEVMVFNGQENVALRKPVHTSSKGKGEGNSRKARFAVDGFVPYLMDAFQGEQSIAFVSKMDIGEKPTMSLDLGEPYAINRIHLHATDLSDTVPHSTPATFGIPKKVVLEGANQADFSDAEQLLEFQQDSVFEVGPIIMLGFPKTVCRYVRLIALDPYIGNEPRGSGSQIGFAEIELFSNGRNVAQGKSILTNFEASTPDRTLAALTDGKNLYGQILPIRSWMQELARRHDLETERPIVANELQQRYTRQKTNLRRMGWLAALLAVGIIITVLLDRMKRERDIAKIKERFAADLHDELGANIHTIGLLSDCVQGAEDSPTEWKMLLGRIRELTERTGTAIRHCTNILEADDLYIGLVHDMQRAANRIITNFEHDFSIEGEIYLERLPPRTRIDLFLFYKECLVNICRHAQATEITTRLTANSDKITLTITDNGKGITTTPKSLKRRAQLIGAKLSTENPPEGGTCISLSLRLRKWARRK
ncbi:hypothetical protein P4C99_11725 [Pontiellaceae bacterium B1224]|nr:hypothetical protein [Pontiellaceae bacterium B1224]